MKKLPFTILLLSSILIGATAYGADVEPLGTVSSVLTATSEPDAATAQTSLGSAAADAARYATGTDVAILNGGDFDSNLQPGPAYRETVEAVFKEDQNLTFATISYTELKEILEHGVGAITVNENEAIDKKASSDGRFPQISGFAFTYDASAPPGARVTSILDEQGEALEEGRPLSLAAAGSMTSGGYGYEPIQNAADTGISLADALCGYIEYLGTLDEPQGDRITVIGTRDQPLMGGVSFGVIAVTLIVFVLFIAKSKTMNFEVRRDRELSGTEEEAGDLGGDT